MGFLSGAYGKLMAGKLVRDIQYQMTSVQSRLRRVTKEIGLKEKMYQSQQRNMKNQMQLQMQNTVFGAAQALGLPVGYGMSADSMGMFGSQLGQMAMFGTQNILNGGIGAFSNGQMQIYSQIQQAAQMQFMYANNVFDNIFEMQRDADLQALKDLEEDLQTEKDNLESRLKIAQGEYEAKKEEEKQGAQNLKPDYTGQG